MKKAIFYFSFLVLFSWSCDKVDDPLKQKYEFVAGATDTTCTDLLDSTQKVVLLEEFTGAQCNNCPDANEDAVRLANENPCQVVLLGIHAGPFAVPNKPKYPADFRTDMGKEIYEFYNPQGIPAGMFNRAGEKDSAVKFRDEWENTLEQELNDTPSFFLNAELTQNGNSLKATTTITAMGDISTDLYYCAYVYEDSLVAPQLQPDGTTIIKDYVHDHVLRGSFNGTFGEEVTIGAIADGETFTMTNTLPIKSKWTAKHLGVVVFVYDFQTKEIFQAGKAKLK